MSANLHVLIEAEPCLKGDVADGSADPPVPLQLSQVSFFQYLGGTASSMDHQHVGWTFLGRSCHSGFTGPGRRAG